jgi:FkbM family methyltransferase
MIGRHSRLWWAIRLLPQNASGILRRLVKHGPKFLPVLYCRAAWFFCRRVPRVRTPEGLVVETYRDLIAYWTTFVQGDLSGEWEHSLRPGDWVIDIGANRGWFRDYASSLCPGLNFMTFEPQRIYQQRLQRPDTKAYCVALSDREGSDVLHLVKDADGGNTASLIEESPTGDSESVPLARLDSFTAEIERIHMIKIDVDGGEIPLIKGGMKTLAKTRFIICEVLDDANMATMKQLLPGWTFRPTSMADYLGINPAFSDQRQN